jgi:hypothetical protein
VVATEADLLKLLRQRHTKSGNGGSGEYAFMPQVRNSAGFNSSRTFDAVVMSLWPSRGLQLHAFEIKCSRNDWLRELKDPAKAEAAARLVDRFSLVVADDKIVKDGELPEPWGLLVARGDADKRRLVCVKEAPLLPFADSKRPVPRDFLVAMLRSAGAVPTYEPKELADARRAGMEQQKASDAERVQGWKESRDEIQRRVNAFEKAAGVSISFGHIENVGAAVRAVLGGEERVAKTADSIRRARSQLLDAAAALEQFLPTES